ncbi:MAG: type II toxin-antitoxin system HicB family antitoxin [Caldisericaceae bacterium]
MKNIASFTVRIPASLHKKAKEISKIENKSLNEVIRELVKEWLKKEEEKLLFEAFSKVGEEDIEYAFNAQKEVIFTDEKPKKI